MERRLVGGCLAVSFFRTSKKTAQSIRATPRDRSGRLDLAGPEFRLAEVSRTARIHALAHFGGTIATK
jgi:hypothetical protein